MKILQVCALASVCVLATCALALVAMGYSIRLEAPESHAFGIGTGVAAASNGPHGNSVWVLADDGAFYEFRRDQTDHSVSVSRLDEAGGGTTPNPPIPTSEIVWWNMDQLLGQDGRVYSYNFFEDVWVDLAVPTLPISTPTEAVSGIKGRYKGN